MTVQIFSWWFPNGHICRYFPRGTFFWLLLLNRRGLGLAFNILRRTNISPYSVKTSCNLHFLSIMPHDRCQLYLESTLEAHGRTFPRFSILFLLIPDGKKKVVPSLKDMDKKLRNRKLGLLSADFKSILVLFFLI